MILVTGAGGTVGSEVVKQLKAQGAPFKAAFHNEKKAEAAGAKGLDTAIVDFGRPETLTNALKGIDKLFLLSGGLPNQTELELNAVKAAKEAGVGHVVKLSVWGAETEEFSFARVHRPVEKAIEKSGMAWTHLRPNGFMQNMHNFNAGTIKSQGAFYAPAGETKISHVDVRDIAAVAARVLTGSGHERKAYALSGPEALTYGQIAKKIADASGRPVNFVNVPEEAYKQALVGAGVPAAYADSMLDLYRYYREDKSSKVTGDVRSVTGRDPIKFDQYAKDYAASFKD